MTPFMLSGTNVALPAIQSDFQLDAIILAWVPTAYLLSCAVFLLPLGKMADIYGRKKIFIYGIWIFTISSFLTAVSLNAAMLIISRVIQGVASAMIFSTSLAILTSVFPPLERGKAIGITVGAVYMGLSTGPFVGGVLTHHFSWRMVFVVAIPIGIAAIYLSTWKLVGEWREEDGEKLDVVGSIIYGIAILLVMYGFSVLPSLNSLWAIAVGLVLLGLFIYWEGKVASPVINPDLFYHNRTFAFSSLAALINYSATFAVTFMLSLYLQYIKGLTSQTAGLVLMAQPIVMAVFSPLAGMLSDRIQPRKIASLGMAMTVTGLFCLTFLEFTTSIAFIVAVLILLGFGFGLFSSPNMNAIMSSVDKKYYGIASGTVGSMRLLGNMLSMGIATLVFSLYIGRVQITPQYYPALLKSLKTAFTIFAVLCVLGIFASLARGKLRRDNPPAE
jgi:EmrB/QacA subfamily drug resistance transporter